MSDDTPMRDLEREVVVIAITKWLDKRMAEASRDPRSDAVVALAPSWIAFAHGYAHQPDWHSDADWRDCQSFPCNEARAALTAPGGVAMTGWRHADGVGEEDECWGDGIRESGDLACGCDRPTPEPASPPYIPTRCTCGHPIEPHEG